MSSSAISGDEIRRILRSGLPTEAFKGRKVLLIVPDHTRTAPVGQLFKETHAWLGPVAKQIDVMVALGTHPAMTQEAILNRLDLTPDEKTRSYSSVKLLNHSWDEEAALVNLGSIPAADIRELSGGLFEMEVVVKINRAALDYDELIILGPTFPHEVVGFSGGNKYLFPGIGGPEILNFFHWLGAVVTNPGIIGKKWTPVRKVVDRAAAMVPTRKWCASMVVRPDGSLAGLHVGTPEVAWEKAADQSACLHIVRKPKAFRQIISCAPTMYDELWVAGKCMYKLEPVLADGGELIIYAPHLTEISITHGRLIRKIGYHCRDYFLKQWDKFKEIPWGVLAHSTHVYGGGTYENGIEKPRARVVLATGIPEEVCREINLGYRDPKSINKEDFANREEDGILL
ncbi:MAG: lactate racemase domain-containing protein, partial [Verrucomicrobia bacterium]|nr:lactate racemase domain-containing protein [Verrucomicrobiota bacterium]